MKRNIAKRICLVLCACMIFSLCSCSASDSSSASSNPNSSAASTAPTSTAKDELVRIAFGGNNASTSSYVISVAYGEIVNTSVENVSMTVEETGGGYEVLTQLIDGELDGASASDVPAYAAINHTGQFEGVENSDNFYAWLPMYTSPVQAVVKTNSSIQCYGDFEGKRIGIDVVGTGSEAIHRAMFEACGINATLVNVSKNESMEMLKTGELDVAMITTAAPTSCVVEFGTTEEFRIIPLTTEEQDKAVAALGYVAPDTLPANTYNGQTEAVFTVSLYTNAYLSTELPEDTVYEMTKAIWNNLDRLKTAHPSQELLSSDMVKGVLIVNEYHPGAAKYYHEMGWID